MSIKSEIHPNQPTYQGAQTTRNGTHAIHQPLPLTAVREGYAIYESGQESP
jgi:hypothetical protein